MAQEKEPKGITRRQFLKGITALGASALLSSCGVKEEPVSQKPAETPSTTEEVPPVQTPVKTKEPTAVPSPESAPTPEITRIVGLTITADYLKNAFAGIGGEERLNMMTFGQGYVSDSWGKSSAFSALSKEPIDSLKYLVSLGSFRGEEGVFSPGKQQEEVVFPQLEKLSLARMELNRVASEVDQKNQEFPQWTFPQGLLIRSGTQMTVVGLLDRSETPEEITVDKESADNGQLDYALVAFTDYLRASQAGVPRHYFAIIPTHFPADPENKNALSLQNLLEANGYQYDSQSKEITVVDQDKQKTILGLNRIEGEELIKDLRQAVGLAFVDQIDGELIKNPVVPYPDEMPQTWTVKQEPDGGLILQAQNQEGNFDDFAKAVYDQEKEAWSWEKIFSPEELLAKAPQIEGLRAVWQEDRIIYQAEAGNPYNLESGEYAGYLFEFNDETGVSSGQGLALAGEVRRKLLEQANTPEAVEQGEWRMTFPFDPKGERIRVWHARATSIAISGLLAEVKFKSPFVEQTLAKWYPQDPQGIGLWIPENLLKASQKGMNYALSIYFSSAEKVSIKESWGRQVSFDELLFTGIGEKNLPTPPFPAGCQIVIAGGSLSGPIDFSMNRILMVDQSPVFGLDKD